MMVSPDPGSVMRSPEAGGEGQQSMRPGTDNATEVRVRRRERRSPATRIRVGESYLKRGPGPVSEAGSAPLAQDETSEEEFEPCEYGEENLEIRKYVPPPEDQVPVEENVGCDLGVDAGIAPPEERVDHPPMRYTTP